MDETEIYNRTTDLAARISKLERKVDFMLAALKLEYQEPAEPAFVAQMRTLMAQHKPLDAIKIYRAQTGAGMAEAKAFLDNL